MSQATERLTWVKADSCRSYAGKLTQGQVETKAVVGSGPTMRGIGPGFASVFVSGFLAVYFLQAGLDKLLDRKSNLMRYRVAFDQSPMRRPAGAWLWMLTLGEMFAGVLSAAGCLTLVFTRDRDMAFGGAVLGALSLLFFFFGLRLGRDYSGASQLVPYFVTCLAALVLLSP